MHPHRVVRQNAALSHGKSCSAYAAKLISFTSKKKLFANYISVYKNCGRETRTHHILCQKWGSTTVDGKYWHSKPLMRTIFCQSNFHAVRRSMQKLCQSMPHWCLHYFQHLLRSIVWMCLKSMVANPYWKKEQEKLWQKLSLKFHQNHYDCLVLHLVLSQNNVHDVQGISPSSPTILRAL